jgi:hypothetical protein
MLNEVGFSWSLRSTWKDRFEELLEYKETHDDTSVPKRYPVNTSLGLWVMTQRQQHKKYCEGTQPCSLDFRRREDPDPG